MSDRTILHCDCNGFYASVECLLRPELKQVPMAVCGDPESRHGIILAKNELAKKFQIQTAETVWQAKRKCPQLVLVPPHRQEYVQYSQRINQIYQTFTDQVEPFGIDESWLDVTGSENLFGDGVTIANSLRRIIREEIGLTISVGVSFNKIFAKLGSDYRKPDATTVISRENFQQMVWKLPVSALLYVGKSVEKELSDLAIFTIGDLAAMQPAILSKKLGKLGEQLHAYANGLDLSPVRRFDQPAEVKSIGNSMTYRRNLCGLEDIRLGVITLADSVGSRLRRHKVKCQTVQVTIKDPRFHTITRQRTLDNPTQLSKDLAEISLAIIREEWDLRAPIRMLAITGSNLVDESQGGQQLSLFQQVDQAKQEKREKLEATMDQIRGKFGGSALQIAGVLENDLGIHTGHIWNRSPEE